MLKDVERKVGLLEVREVDHNSSVVDRNFKSNNQRVISDATSFVICLRDQSSFH